MTNTAREQKLFMAAAIVCLFSRICLAEGIGLELLTDSRSVYAGQQFGMIARVVYPAGLNLGQLKLNLAIPRGLSQVRVQRPQQVGMLPGSKGRMEVMVLRRIIFARTPGKTKIGPAVLGLSPLLAAREKKNRVVSNMIDMTVKPLPQGAPKDFGGIVGTLELGLRLNTRTVLSGGELRLAVRVKGDARPDSNVQEALNVSGLDAFSQVGETAMAKASDVFDGKLLTTWNIQRRYRVVSGSGETELSVSLVVFDPVLQTYKILAGGPYRIVYSAGDEPSLPAPVKKTLGPDEDRSATESRTQESWRAGRIAVGAVAVLLCVLFAVAAFIIVRRRSISVPGSARIHLASAQRRLRDDEDSRFLSAVGRAVREALFSCYDIEPFGPLEAVTRELERKGASAEIIAEVRTVMQRCAQRAADTAPLGKRGRRLLLASARKLCAKLKRKSR